MKNEGILQNVSLPVYDSVVNVMINKTCAKAVKISHRMRKVRKLYKWDNMTGCYFFHSEKNIHAIILSKDADIDTVSHECFHAVMKILQIKGVIYCEESEESFAYALGWLTKEVWRIKQEYDINTRRK